MINGIKIMNLEGSDILKNNLEGREIKKEYNGVFTNSLLQDKLTALGLKVNKETTRDIVTVKFTYGYTPLIDNLNDDEIKNLQEQNKKIKQDIKVLEKDKKSISKRTDKRAKIDEIKKLKDCLKNNKVKISTMQIEDKVVVTEAKMNTDKIRNKLYKDGFKLEFKGKISDKKDIVEYTLWYRTPSKSRVGDAVFINKKLYNDIKKWQRMGLELPEGEAKVVEMTAYEALTSSNIIDKITIDPYKNILVVDDIVSFFETNCNIVKTNKGECYVSPELYKVSNTLFDGQALLDDSLWLETDNSSFKLLRQHFFKACGFRTYITQFMKDSFKDNYESATVTDRYGNEIKVSEILLITTENSMKWEKFQDIGASYDLWRQKVSEDGNVFGVAKVDHVSKYNNIFEDGKCYQRMSYQHVNTLYLKKVKRLMK